MDIICVKMEFRNSFLPLRARARNPSIKFPSLTAQTFKHWKTLKQNYSNGSGRSGPE